MFRSNISTMSDSDLYGHTVVRLESITKMPKAKEAIRLLKLMEHRPILDADLAIAGKKCLNSLKAALAPETSSDYWYDSLVGNNGDLQPRDLNNIANLVEERRAQIQFINAVLSRL